MTSEVEAEATLFAAYRSYGSTAAPLTALTLASHDRAHDIGIQEAVERLAALPKPITVRAFEASGRFVVVCERHPHHTEVARNGHRSGGIVREKYGGGGATVVLMQFAGREILLTDEQFGRWLARYELLGVNWGVRRYEGPQSFGRPVHAEFRVWPSDGESFELSLSE